MVAEDKFKYDPEAEQKESGARYRLPFALCKKYGIAIQDWWTPRDAWNALKNGEGVNVSDEYAEMRRRQKKAYEKARRRDPERLKRKKLRDETKKRQLSSEAHNPIKGYTHKEGAVAGVKQGKPMTFKQAAAAVNPFFMKADPKTGVNYIGYRTNCQTCVATYFARRQGYDVRALPNLNNRNIADLSVLTNLAYVDESGKHPTAERKPRGKTTSSWLSEKMKPNDIYSLEWTWKGRSSGHIITVEKDSAGRVTVYDPQTNTKFDGFDKVKGLYKNAQYGSVRATKLTGCRIDEKFCDGIMRGEK